MKKIYYYIVLILSSFFLISGCSEPNTVADLNTEVEEVNEDVQNPGYEAGVLRVKLTPEMGEQISISSEGQKLRSGVSHLDEYMASIHAVSMEPVFKLDKRFEKRHRKAGLHLWYEIKFDDSITTTRALRSAQSLPGVDIVEEVPIFTQEETVVYNLLSDGFDPFSQNSVPERTADQQKPFFNDPSLVKQWHYHNDGSNLKSIARADINLFEAWQKQVGKPNVLVAIIDGGVDYAHEDLFENMWVNPGEVNGDPEVDNDGNNYNGDVHGYNFARDTCQIDADDHGTHVAGTVAARNNNGIGVCGVAGGDGTPESGIRMMTLQVFGMNDTGRNVGRGFEKALVYAADNGAVVAQNSWGSIIGIPMTPSVREAIDYFIANAGCDDEGNQLPDSPMKGGIVIFAAGNEGAEGMAYPAAYPAVVAVSSMAPNWEASYFSNRGDWVDIMAPGGDKFFPFGQVMSTAPRNGYAYMQGTSMACPHVSGVAALIVSEFGGPGFTADACRKILESSLRPQDIDKNNPSLAGKLGAGYVDAARALDRNGKQAPDKIAKVDFVENFVDIDFEWIAVEDKDDNTAMEYLLYYSEVELNEANYNKQGTLKNVNALPYKHGDKVTYTLGGLKLDTKYFFAIVSRDRWGLTSKPYFLSATTLKNLPPKLDYTLPESIRLTGSEQVSIKIKVTEPESQKWRAALTEQLKGVSLKVDGDLVTIDISAREIYGKHEVTLNVSDIYDAVSTVVIPFEIYENTPPVLEKKIENIYLPVNTDKELDLSKYFVDKDGHKITYEVISHNKSIVDVQLKDAILKVNSLGSLGQGSLEVKAFDTQNGSTRTSIQVQVVKEGLVYQVYPIPASTELNVRLSNETTAAKITIRSATTGSLFMTKDVNFGEEADHLVKLDVSKLSGGTYMLHVESNGKKYKQSFIKY